MAATSILGPAISLIRPAVNAVVGDLWRRWQVGRKFAFRTPSENSPVVKKALADLEVLLGNNALLTTSVANLLDDLKSTGLLELIARDAFYELHDEGVRIYFEIMFARHSADRRSPQLERECRELYKTIQFLLRESIRAQVSSDLLLVFDMSIKPNRHGTEFSVTEKIRAVVSEIRPDIAKRVELAGRNLLAFSGDSPRTIPGLASGQYPAWLFLTPEKLSQAVKAISESLIGTYQSVRLDGPAQRTIECEIDKLYVPARLVEADFSIQANSLQAREGTEALFDRLISRATQCVVLGDPGGGKSTLAQRICLDALRRSSEDGRYPLAVKVEVRRFTRGSADAFDNLVAFIAAEIGRQAIVPSTDVNLVSLVQHLLFFGRMLIVFDGVDEIISAPKRREVIATTQQLANRFLQDRFVYTCRRTDFLTTPIRGLPIFLLRPFNPDEIRAYFRSASQHVFARSEEDIATREPDFLKQALEHAAEFIRNPLLLALIVWIYNVGQRIPDNRIELYHECSELLFRRWDSLKEIDPELPDAHWLFQLVTEIAHRLYLLNRDEEGDSNAQWLKLRALEFFRTVYEGDVENRAMAASNRFVEHLTGRSWVLQERSAGIFEFTHRTFMEYYFARWLDDAYDGIDILFAKVAERIRAGEWTVPIHLAFQMKAAGKLRSAEALTAALIDLIERTHMSDEERKIASSGQPELPSVVHFVVGSIGYLQPSEASMVRITRSLSSAMRTKAEWFSTIGGIVASPTEFHSAIAEGVHQALADDIANRRGYTVGFVVDWLYACYLSKRARHSIQFPGHVLKFSDVRERFGASFLAQVESKGGALASLPKMTFDLTGTTLPAVAEVGLGMWVASITPDQRLDWRLVDFGLGLMESLDVLLGDLPGSDSPYVQFFAALSSVIPDQRNYSISGGVGVMASFNCERLSAISDQIRVCDREVALSFAVSLIGFTELVSRMGIAVVSVDDVESVERATRGVAPGLHRDVVDRLLRIVCDRTDIPSKFSFYIEGWVARTHAMFKPFERTDYVDHRQAFSGLRVPRA